MAKKKFYNIETSPLRGWLGTFATASARAEKIEEIQTLLSVPPALTTDI